MSNLQARLASALLLSVAANAGLMAGPAARAADSCIAEPKAESPQGKHWYYHIERGTGRHCWYLRGQDDISASADDDKQATSDQAPPAKVDPASARTFADAHAEIAPKAASPDSTNAAAAPSVWPAPQAANTA